MEEPVVSGWFVRLSVVFCVINKIGSRGWRSWVGLSLVFNGEAGWVDASPTRSDPKEQWQLPHCNRLRLQLPGAATLSEGVLKHIPGGSDTDAHHSVTRVPESFNREKTSKTIESNLWLIITLSTRPQH